MTGSACVLAEPRELQPLPAPLDNRREWYRYHHLFGELLQHELALGLPEEVPEPTVARRGGHIAEGSVDDAIGHAAAAGDLAQAA